MPREIKTILILDDDDAIRTTLTFGLEMEGFCPIERSNGQEGLQWILEHPQTPPHLVILDLNMPVMDGADFLTALRGMEDRVCRALPVIVISAELEVGLEIHSKAQSVLRKPFHFDELIQEIQGLLQSSVSLTGSLGSELTEKDRIQLNG